MYSYLAVVVHYGATLALVSQTELAAAGKEVT